MYLVGQESSAPANMSSEIMGRITTVVDFEVLVPLQ